MADHITLTCPSCGGKLQITNDIERFACGHCGNEHIVRRGSGIILLAPVVEGLQRVQTGVDKTASELAIKRLKDEIL
jgi:ribosomal protein S27AE